MIGTIIGAVYEIPNWAWDKRVIGSFKGFIDRSVDGKCFLFLLLYRVCTHVRLVILETCLSVHVCVVV